MKISKIVFLIVGLCFLSLELFAQVHQDWATTTDSISTGYIAADSAGNVYVAGGIYRGLSGFNICLVKYDSIGNQQWRSEYNGIGNGLDGATAIALDNSGNIFVTGYSFRGPANTNDEIVTIKYNPNGDSLWTRRYNSLGSKIDRAFALAVDSAGNVYVGGYINSISYGNSYGKDYITIKYSSDGTQLWATQMYVGDGSVNDLAVDQSGNVYVTGLGFNSSVTGHDYITVKYNSSGDSIWAKHYGGLSSEPFNNATSIAIGQSGNIYVSGFSRGANWYFDYATIKYNDAGEELWVSRFDGPINEDDKAIGIEVDKDENIYVTGEASVLAGFSYIKDFATVKYNKDGDSLWVRYYNGPAYSVDSPIGMAIDTSGNIYVTGASYGLGTNYSTNYDYATIKYNSDGDSVWVQRYDAADFEDRPQSIALDKSGNVYVTGISTDNLNSSGSITIKYSQSITPFAIDTELPAVGTGSSTFFGDAHLTFFGDVTFSDSITVYYYLVAPLDGELPEGIIWIGKYFWRVVNGGTVFTNGYIRLSTEDLVGITAGGCGACLVWLKRSNSGDPWQNIGGLFEGTFESGFLTSNIPFDSFSEFAIGSTEDPTLLVSENSEPNTFALAQNFPNPFNPSTIINFSIPTSEFVTIKIFDVLGSKIATLVNETKQAGNYEVNFDASNIPSGVYFYRMQAGKFIDTKKMILLR